MIGLRPFKMVSMRLPHKNFGDVFVKSIDYTPTWVHRYTGSDGLLDYNVVPLKQAISDPSTYGLLNSSFGKSHATAALGLTDPVFADAVLAYNTSAAEDIYAFSATYNDNLK